MTIWCDKNNLRLNTKKTQLIHFRQANSTFDKNAEYCNSSVKVKGTEIKPSDTVKYLGVVLDKHLNFKDQVNSVCKKMSVDKFKMDFKIFLLARQLLTCSTMNMRYN